MQNNKITLTGLIEIRVKEPNMKAMIKVKALGWGIMHNDNATSNGRIWMIWDDNWYETNLINSTT